MSVRGEFRRLVSDTVACLQACDGEAALALARRLEEERASAADDLVGAAERVLVAWDAAHADVEADRATSERLADAAERMQQIARIVLGHSL